MVRRLKIWHDRDSAVIGDNHWNLSLTDTDDPHAPPEMVGWGSYEACRATAAGLVDLKERTGIRP